MDFPLFKTKMGGKKFNLTDPKDVKKYFDYKAGKEIKLLKKYLNKNTFVAYLLGKKNAGKGTYSKMFAGVVAPDKIDHFSIGDMVRGIDSEMKDAKKKKELYGYLEKNYRGKLPLEDITASLEKRSTKILLPTELVLTLAKRELEKRDKKTLFIDGFPRDMDQISFSLFFRDLVGHRDDPDVFVLIDVPEKVIDERIKWRRICPSCQTSRNIKLLLTSKPGYDKQKKEFYLECDNSQCSGPRMVQKEGDESGIEPIKERLKMDGYLMEQALGLYGIPKVLLRNSIPQKEAKKLVDDYELTPEYVLDWNDDASKVKVTEKPWLFEDEKGVPSYSLMPQPVVVSMIKQLVKALGL